ncbi:MAG: tetratricopeptide repeat protein [Bacteroidales bacterium]|nr:tetratricopeptide repeat protein [Bacteroidales bacterium]
MRKSFLYVVLLLIGCSLWAQEPDGTDLFLTATAEYAEGQYAQAREKLQSLHAQDPQDDAVNYYLGLCELAMRDLDSAEEHLSLAVSADSTNTWYVYALASLYDARGDQVRSGAYVEKLVKMNPALYNNPNTLSMVADSKVAARQDSVALRYYDQALEQDPGYAPAQLGRTELLRRMGNYPAFFAGLEDFIGNEDVRPGVKSHYLTALMDNVDAPFYWVWGETINRLVDLDLHMHPDDYDIQLLKLRMCYIKQDWDAVLTQCGVMADLARAQDDKDHLAEALSIAGDVYYQQFQDRKKAYETYELALEADPDRTSVLNNYAYYLSLEGRSLRKALRMSQRTVELEPDNATYLDTYGWLLYLLGRPKDAKPHFKHAMLYGGKDSATILEHYSKVLEALGEDDLSLYYKNLAEQKQQQEQ